MTEPNTPTLSDFTEQDLTATLNHALGWVGGLGVAGGIAVWLAAGWQSALLFLVGALIAATGLYESKRLMLAVLSRFNAGREGKPVAGVLIWFFLRLILSRELFSMLALGVWRARCTRFARAWDWPWWR